MVLGGAILKRKSSHSHSGSWPGQVLCHLRASSSPSWVTVPVPPGGSWDPPLKRSLTQAPDPDKAPSGPSQHSTPGPTDALAQRGTLWVLGQSCCRTELTHPPRRVTGRGQVLSTLVCRLLGAPLCRPQSGSRELGAVRSPGVPRKLPR